MLISKQTNKQCFQKYIRCISDANDAGNASVACAVNTDDVHVMLMLMVRQMLQVGDALQKVNTDDALQLAYAVDVLQSVLILGMGRYQ